MEPLGTALLTDEIPASRAVTAIVSREEIAGALRDPDHAPELYLDLDRPGDERTTIAIGWTHDELEQLLDRTLGDDILFTFDRDQLQLAFDDVEAHGLREKALVFAVVAAGALGSGAAIANASPIIEPGGGGAASVAAVQSLATDSTATTSNAHTPGVQIGPGESTAATPSASVSAAKAADDAVASNVHTPGVQIGPGESAAATPSASVSAAKVADDAVASNVHTPGVQIGPGESTAATPSASVSAAKVADDGIASNVHTPGLQIGPGESTPATRSVQVSAGSSDGEFLGIDTRDATEALIAGGVLLAIAGATFAGTRRPGSARPA